MGFGGLGWGLRGLAVICARSAALNRPGQACAAQVSSVVAALRSAVSCVCQPNLASRAPLHPSGSASSTTSAVRTRPPRLPARCAPSGARLLPVLFPHTRGASGANAVGDTAACTPAATPYPVDHPRPDRQPVWNIEYKAANFNALCPNQLAFGVRSILKVRPRHQSSDVGGVAGTSRRNASSSHRPPGASQSQRPCSCTPATTTLLACAPPHTPPPEPEPGQGAHRVPQ